MFHASSKHIFLFAASFLLVFACLCVKAQECEDEDCLAIPRIGDPDRTLPPLPTPKNNKPASSYIGSGLVQEISCSNPGVSSSALTECTARNRARDISINNNGRIPLIVFFIRPGNSLQRAFELRPGQTQRLANPTCVNHRWLVQSTCGDCMAVYRVVNTRPETISISNNGIEATCPGPLGKWSAPRRWKNGLVAAGLANIPGGDRVLGFSGVKVGSFSRVLPAPEIPRSEARITQVEIYDYTRNQFIGNDLIGHNMFCAAITLLPDGKLFAQGGGDGPDAKFVSTFDPFAGPNGRWRRHGDTNNGHWYGTVVVTQEQRLLLALGVDKVFGFREWKRAFDFPEISRGFDFSRPWQNMTGVDLDGKQPDNLHWYPFLHLMPDGDILESGTQNRMWRISTAGTGSVSPAGKRNRVRNENESWGASTIMYDEGKLLAVGGIENWQNDSSPGRFVYKRAIVIEMNNANTISTRRTDDMNYQRAFVNTVVLPSGEVLAVGGKNNLNQWDDTLSVRQAEIWNPLTDKWTVLARQQAPRNYHSAAILLRDGRVLSAGGGLCGTCDETDAAGNRLNQPTSEIFSPPYLFNSNGVLKDRPRLSRSPQTAGVNDVLNLRVTGPRAGSITRVSIVKQCAVTHSISTDARQLSLQIVGSRRQSNTRYTYQVRTNSNINVMTPGYWFLFVLDSTGTPSIARDLRVVV